MFGIGFLFSWFIGLWGPKISYTKTQTLLNFRLPISSHYKSTFCQFAVSANAKAVRSPRPSPHLAVQREGLPSAPDSPVRIQRACAKTAQSSTFHTSWSTTWITGQRDVSVRTDCYSSKENIMTINSSKSDLEFLNFTRGLPEYN